MGIIYKNGIAYGNQPSTDAVAMIDPSEEASATSAHAYAVGEHFIYNDTLYRATAAIAIGDTITPGTNCVATNVMTEVESGGGGGGSEKLNSTQAADAYDPTATYAVGDKVSYAGNVYSCISAISTPEAWDSTHWDQVDPIQDQVDGLRNTLNSEIATRQTYVRPNLLDNWYFGRPVNQRGQTSYSNAGYTIDRWKLTSGSVGVVSGGITLNGTLVQILEASIGQTVTASALLSDGSMITPTYNDNTKTFALTATGQTIKAVKLELGSGQTLAHQENGVWVLNEIPDYGEQLLRCQRNLYRYNCPTPHFSSTDTYMMLPIVHDFAATPSSIVESADISWYRIDGVQTNITTKTLEIADATVNSLNIKLTPTPAPGSSNKKKLGYITRLNVLVSAET